MTRTAPAPASATHPLHRVWAWFPDRVDRRVAIFAWLSFLAEVIIIGTGGAVRLTGSGLGCSDWPLCTPESLVPIYEVQGLHGVIEFGNRLMTSVVGLLALAVLLCVLKFRRERRDLFVLALIVIGGVVAQAVVGGITVLTKLNPFIVGFHYVASLLLVCTTALFLARLHTTPGARERAVPKWYAILMHATGLVLAVTIFVGVLTTASGPHSGDDAVVRQGFDATILAHVHAWPGYVLAALLAVLTAVAAVKQLPTLSWLFALILAVAVQITVGVIQARTGLPPVLVGIHMVLASLSAAAYTVTVTKLRRPRGRVTTG